MSGKLKQPPMPAGSGGVRMRAHLGASITDMLRAQGALEGLPETSQVDMFSILQ